MAWKTGVLDKNTVIFDSKQKLGLAEEAREELDSDWGGYSQGAVLFVLDGLEVNQIVPYPSHPQDAVKTIKKMVGLASHLDVSAHAVPMANILASYYVSDTTGERAKNDAVYVHREEDFSSEDVVRAIFALAGLSDRLKRTTESLSDAGGIFGFRGREVTVELVDGSSASSTVYELAGVISGVVNPLIGTLGSQKKYYKIGVVAEKMGGVYVPLDDVQRTGLRNVFIPTY